MSKLDRPSHINAGATDAQIHALMNASSISLPDHYLSLLRKANGLSLNNGVIIDAADEVLERNATFEVQEYAPGYFAIGDDSGGRAIVLHLSVAEVMIVHQCSRAGFGFCPSRTT